MKNYRVPHFFASRLVAACMMAWLATAAGPVRAQDEVSKVPVPRSESLELPGLTAGCHICEWRPKLNQMPADEECGADQSGNAKIGLFECGFSQDCKRECRFLRCGPL